MFFPTKPGSEEYGDNRLKQKKVEHFIYNRVFVDLDAKQGPFAIQLNELEIKEVSEIKEREAAAPLSGSNVSGSEHENSKD